MKVEEARTVKIGDTLTDIIFAGYDYLITDIIDLKRKVVFVGDLISHNGKYSTTRTNRQVNFKTE